MYELPEGLANSLRSWRGNVYNTRNGVTREAEDLEKGGDDQIYQGIGQELRRGVTSKVAVWLPNVTYHYTLLCTLLT